MATAQCIEKYKCELLWDNKNGEYCRSRPEHKRYVYIYKGPGNVIIALTNRMEKSDTVAEKLIGYGLCGIAGMYLTGHLLKAFF